MPEIFSGIIAFEAIAFPKPNHIQPVSCPSLAVVRRVEKLLDLAAIGLKLAALPVGFDLEALGLDQRR